MINFKDKLYDEKIRTKIPFPFIKEVEFEKKNTTKIEITIFFHLLGKKVDIS